MGRAWKDYLAFSALFMTPSSRSFTMPAFGREKPLYLNVSVPDSKEAHFWDKIEKKVAILDVAQKSSWAAIPGASQFSINLACLCNVSDQELVDLGADQEDLNSKNFSWPSLESVALLTDENASEKPLDPLLRDCGRKGITPFFIFENEDSFQRFRKDFWPSGSEFSFICIIPPAWSKPQVDLLRQVVDPVENQKLLSATPWLRDLSRIQQKIENFASNTPYKFVSVLIVKNGIQMVSGTVLF